MTSTALVAQLEKQRRKVDFDTYDIHVQQLTTMVASGVINVAPAYQRQFRWDDTKRSHLIESVFLGIPVPSLFMATNPDGTWEVVDGVQRLGTIVQFAGDEDARNKLSLATPLTLENLDKLSELNGLRFKDLPDSLKLKFLHRPIKVITLSDKSDKIVRFDLFERLNTGGVLLTNQEIRACIYRGAFANFLERMAKNDTFHRAVLLTKRQEEDGTREEFVLRFFAFLSQYEQFSHSVVDFLNDYMARASEDFDYSDGQRIFESTFEQLSRLLPRGIVRSKTRKSTPVNLFEGVAVGAALAIKEKGHIVSQDVYGWIDSKELRRYTTGATNSRAMVAGRIEYCRDKFIGR